MIDNIYLDTIEFDTTVNEFRRYVQYGLRAEDVDNLAFEDTFIESVERGIEAYLADISDHINSPVAFNEELIDNLFDYLESLLDYLDIGMLILKYSAITIEVDGRVEVI